MNTKRTVVPVACAMMWGSAFTFIPFSLQSFSPLNLMAIRFGLAALCYAALVSVGIIKTKPLPPAAWPRFLVVTLIAVVVYNLALNNAMQHLPPGLVIVIGQAAPILILVMERFRSGGYQVSHPGIAVATWFIGLGLLMLHFRTTILDAASWSSLALALVTPLAIATYTVLARPLLRTYGASNVCAQMFGVGGTLIFVAQGWRAEFWSDLAGASAASIASVVCLVLFTTVLAYTLWFRQVEAHGASAVATYLTLVPLFGIGSASIAFGEPMSLCLIGGLGVTIIGCHASSGVRSATASARA